MRVPISLSVAVAFVIGFAVPFASAPTAAQSVNENKLVDLCSLFLPQDLAVLAIPAVGTYATDPYARQCKWSSKSSSLSVSIYRNAEDAESIWNSNREKYDKQAGATLKNEPNIGLHAFSVVFTQKNGDPPQGATFFIIQKNQRLLSLSIQSKAPGTEQLRDQLRTLAKKADSATL